MKGKLLSGNSQRVSLTREHSCPRQTFNITQGKRKRSRNQIRHRVGHLTDLVGIFVKTGLLKKTGLERVQKPDSGLSASSLYLEPVLKRSAPCCLLKMVLLELWSEPGHGQP